MGLDGLELIMEIEESFGVTIANTEARACVTPAALIDLVFGKLQASDKRVCVSQRAFYLLRKGLTGTLGISRRKVNLSTDIRSFTAGKSEQEVWDNLKTSVQARNWPPLTRPRWIKAGIWILSLATFYALITFSHWAVAAACAVLVAYVAARITRPFRSSIPARYSRLRTLVPFAATSDRIFWTRDQVATLVKKSVIQVLGLRDEQYREDAHFVKVLGMN